MVDVQRTDGGVIDVDDGVGLNGIDGGNSATATGPMIE